MAGQRFLCNSNTRARVDTILQVHAMVLCMLGPASLNALFVAMRRMVESCGLSLLPAVFFSTFPHIKQL